MGRWILLIILLYVDWGHTLGIEHKVATKKKCGILIITQPSVYKRSVNITFRPVLNNVGLVQLYRSRIRARLDMSRDGDVFSYTITSLNDSLSGQYNVRCFDTNDDYLCDGRYARLDKPRELTGSGLLYMYKRPSIKVGDTVELRYMPSDDVINSKTCSPTWMLKRQNSDKLESIEVDGERIIEEFLHFNNEYMLIVRHVDQTLSGNVFVKCTLDNGESIQTNNVTIQVTEVKTGGLVFNANRGPIVVGDTVKIRYIPTDNIIKEGCQDRRWLLKRKGTYNYETIDVDADRFTELTSGTGYYVTLVINNIDRTMSGSVFVRCDGNDTNMMSVIVTVKPSQPIFTDPPEMDIENCTRCLHGYVGEMVKLTCETRGGTKPVKVKIKVGGYIWNPEESEEGVFTLNRRLYDADHLKEVSCEVTNPAIDSNRPLVTSRRLFLINEPGRPTVHIHTMTVGDLANISCTSKGNRLPPELVFIINNNTVSGVSTSLTDGSFYNSTATIWHMSSLWNDKRLTCCARNDMYRKQKCSTESVLQYIWKPATPWFRRPQYVYFDDCPSCLYGYTGEMMTLTCQTNNGTEPVKAMITVGDTQFLARTVRKGIFSINIPLHNSYHLQRVICEVSNPAVDTSRPLVTSIRLYVITEPDRPVLDISYGPDGYPTNISCVSSGSRPAPKLVFVMNNRSMKANTVSKKTGQYYDSEAFLESLEKQWIKLSMKCCAQHPLYREDICSTSSAFGKKTHNKKNENTLVIIVIGLGVALVIAIIVLIVTCVRKRRVIKALDQPAIDNENSNEHQPTVSNEYMNEHPVVVHQSSRGRHTKQTNSKSIYENTDNTYVNRATIMEEPESVRMDERNVVYENQGQSYINVNTDYVDDGGYVDMSFNSRSAKYVN